MLADGNPRNRQETERGIEQLQQTVRSLEA